MKTTIAGILTVVGCCLLAGGVLTFLVTWYRMSDWRRADGSIVGEKTSLGMDKGRTRTYYAPVIAFECAETGRTHTFEDGVHTNVRPAVGARVPVLYNPLNPDKATVAGWRPYFVPMIVFFGGAILLAFGRFGLG